MSWVFLPGAVLPPGTEPLPQRGSDLVRGRGREPVQLRMEQPHALRRSAGTLLANLSPHGILIKPEDGDIGILPPCSEWPGSPDGGLPLPPGWKPGDLPFRYIDRYAGHYR